MPASNMKLVMAAVALERLGADYRFTTTRRADGAGRRRCTSWAAATRCSGRRPTSTPRGCRGAPSVSGSCRSRRSTCGRRSSRWPTRRGGRRHAGAGPSSATTAATTASASCRRGRPSYAADLEAGPLGALMVDDAFATLHAALRAGGRPCAGTPPPSSPTSSCASAACTVGGSAPRYDAGRCHGGRHGHPARRRSPTSSARCSPRATTTRPSCSSRRSARSWRGRARETPGSRWCGPRWRRGACPAPAWPSSTARGSTVATASRARRCSP